MSADDNIIFDDPDAALELAKSISKTEAEEAEEARNSKCVVIQDTPSALKSKPATSKTKLNGAPSLTPEEQEAADIMQALKASKKTSRRQPGDDHISDTQDVDDEDAKIESDEDDIYKYKIHLRKDEDEEMINAEVDDSDKGDEEIADAAKADVEKTSEAKDDAKKTELPQSSSSLPVSLGFCDQFLKLSSDSSLVSTVKYTTDTDINSLLEVKIQCEVPHSQSPYMLNVPISVISEPRVPTPVQESHSTPVTTIAKLEKDESELKTVDHSIKALAILKSQVPSVVDNYLGSKRVSESSKKQTPIVDLEQGFEKSVSEILQIKREQAEKPHKPKFIIKSTDNATLEEYDLKSALYQSMHANKSFNRNPANH
ncbi:hypothetical protein Tco_0835057 [Tanacetum coccineum]